MNNIKRIIAALLIAFTIVTVYNLSVNGHYHKDMNGFITFHCHPYSNSDNPILPGHYHTKSEFSMTAMLSNYFGIAAFVFIFILLFSNLTQTRLYFSTLRQTKQPEFLNILSHRGPPLKFSF